MTNFLMRAVLFSLSGMMLDVALAAAPAAEYKTVKYKINLPPPAELSYSIKARQSGLAINGDAIVKWHAADNRFSIVTETRTALLGKILDAKSEGTLDEYGLAPVMFTEKRLRKPQASASFDRQTNIISFTNSERTYPVKGGEQDRNSAIWQLVAMARAAPAKFKPGSAWRFPVVGQRSVEPWNFKVIRQEKISTPLGEVNAVHLAKVPAPDSKGEQLDIWLAPALEWYPIKLRYTEADNDFIEQMVKKIDKK